MVANGGRARGVELSAPLPDGRAENWRSVDAAVRAMAFSDVIVHVAMFGVIEYQRVAVGGFRPCHLQLVFARTYRVVDTG